MYFFKSKSIQNVKTWHAVFTHVNNSNDIKIPTSFGQSWRMMLYLSSAPFTGCNPFVFQIRIMSNKRKISDGGNHQQVTLKRFKKSPASTDGGQAKQSNQKKSSKPVGAKALKIAAKWKKKKKYVFKNAKSTPGQNGTFRKKTDDVDGSKKVGDNVEKGDDGKKHRKKRKKKKKPKQADGKNLQKVETEEKDVDERRTKLSETNKDSHKAVNKAWTKEKRKGMKSAGGEMKNQEKSVLPRKPEDVSANWKAMLAVSFNFVICQSKLLCKLTYYWYPKVGSDVAFMYMIYIYSGCCVCMSV